jgi:hypothetical protein
MLALPGREPRSRMIFQAFSASSLHLVRKSHFAGITSCQISVPDRHEQVIIAHGES